jgi:hypothetical protein
MALFGLIDTTETEAFAKSLAEDLLRRYPPSAEGRTDPGAQHQLKVILEGLGTRAVRFKAEHGLGIYKKAKLGTTFKYRLKEGGYSDSFIEAATADIVRRLAVN